MDSISTQRGTPTGVQGANSNVGQFGAKSVGQGQKQGLGQAQPAASFNPNNNNNVSVFERRLTTQLPMSKEHVLVAPEARFRRKMSHPIVDPHVARLLMWKPNEEGMRKYSIKADAEDFLGWFYPNFCWYTWRPGTYLGGWLGQVDRSNRDHDKEVHDWFNGKGSLQLESEYKKDYTKLEKKYWFDITYYKLNFAGKFEWEYEREIYHKIGSAYLDRYEYEMQELFAVALCKEYGVGLKHLQEVYEVCRVLLKKEGVQLYKHLHELGLHILESVVLPAMDEAMKPNFDDSKLELWWVLKKAGSKKAAEFLDNLTEARFQRISAKAKLRPQIINVLLEAHFPKDKVESFMRSLRCKRLVDKLINLEESKHKEEILRIMKDFCTPVDSVERQKRKSKKASSQINH